MKHKSANKKTGCLIYTADGYYFRVYKEKDFTDYKLLHYDMQISINDADAYFYEHEDGTFTLDHSPQTLGKIKDD